MPISAPQRAGQGPELYAREQSPPKSMPGMGEIAKSQGSQNTPIPGAGIETGGSPQGGGSSSGSNGIMQILMLLLQMIMQMIQGQGGGGQGGGGGAPPGMGGA